MTEEEKKPVLEIERMAQLRELQKESGVTNITFDNDGKMVVNNRRYKRDMKRIWRATQEDKNSIRFFTKKKNKSSRKTKKAERQNRRKGRR